MVQTMPGNLDRFLVRCVIHQGCHHTDLLHIANSLASTTTYKAVCFTVCFYYMQGCMFYFMLFPTHKAVCFAVCFLYARLSVLLYVFHYIQGCM